MDVSVSYLPACGRTAVVEVAGAVDVRCSPRLREVLTALAESGRSRLVVDLGRADSLDATGLGVLVGALKRVRAQQGGLVVVTQQPRILDQFAQSGLSRLLAVRPSVRQALALLEDGGARHGDGPASGSVGGPSNGRAERGGGTDQRRYRPGAPLP
ncbi:STAS domain-containing protein [Streptacidiphilus sp. PB12-B1b]|uniref:STAS domain-containing protein n=1 Tax=Streptacidiphilus sp. PB12-B1b TaxID=2705012 RepID=UPI0015FB75EC|nr:STAS domain-containing protein [Streptacidiphilus sp. PB12-B1b]QMU80425.1 STAS domain-containing protein [Streptacidiphilus sp. PB12-B1b]